MKQISALADRAAAVSQALLYALHVLFFAAFLLGALASVRSAHAQGVACTGKDLLAELAQSDPATRQELQAQADKTVNGRGILWRISKPGVADSFLLGTMHMADPRVTTLSPAAQKAFDASKTLVIETTDVLDEKAMIAAVLAEPDLTMFTDGTTLQQHLSKEDGNALAKGLEARGIPADSVARMKPWILSSVVALPACELSRKAAGLPVLDVKLGREAQAMGKPVEGLESAIGQLRAMASLPLEFHMRGLVDTLKLGNKLDDVIETMVVIYRSGDTGMFWPLFRAAMPEEEGKPGYGDFEKVMITTRNKGMAEAAAPILNRGNAFVAVGAMHLAGPDGLVALLQAQGFSLAAVE